ncbi:hypothetical protein EON63_08575 [archaeon]|nr:MAG: hypothetical protein EON63_08575 [archaeon]
MKMDPKQSKSDKDLEMGGPDSNNSSRRNSGDSSDKRRPSDATGSEKRRRNSDSNDIVSIIRRYSSKGVIYTNVQRRNSEPEGGIITVRNPSGHTEEIDTTVAAINARRSGSATFLTTNSHGEVVIERKNTDLKIAVQKRISASSIPNITIMLPRLSSTHVVPPLLNAEDALERTGGKGAAGSYSEHMYPIEVLAEKYHTDINAHDVPKSFGLSNVAAENMLKEYGPNVLTPPPKLPLWALFLLQFMSALMVLLEITALLCIILFIINQEVMDNLYLGLLLFLVVFITCYETYSQEAKSDNLMEQFRAMVPAQASVIREGNMRPINTSELVLGDIIRLIWHIHVHTYTKTHTQAHTHTYTD